MDVHFQLKKQQDSAQFQKEAQCTEIMHRFVMKKNQISTPMTYQSMSEGTQTDLEDQKHSAVMSTNSDYLSTSPAKTHSRTRSCTTTT